LSSFSVSPDVDCRGTAGVATTAGCFTTGWLEGWAALAVTM
jgi:hypothetical protein